MFGFVANISQIKLVISSSAEPDHTAETQADVQLAFYCRQFLVEAVIEVELRDSSAARCRSTLQRLTLEVDAGNSFPSLKHCLRVSELDDGDVLRWPFHAVSWRGLDMAS